MFRSGAKEPHRLSLPCRSIDDGVWLLGIAQLMPADTYDSAVAGREALLATREGCAGRTPAKDKRSTSEE